MNLRKKTIIGVLWNSFELFGGKSIQIVITILLARFLSPEDFGVIGLLIIFTEISKVILDSGFSQALIRKQDAEQIDFTSVFYFNIFVGIVLYLILYMLAPLISDFYDAPELTKISRYVFLTIVINSFGIVQNAKIVKEVNFKILAKRTIFANFIAGLVAVFLAYKGFGVWSLIWQMIIASLIRVVLLWCALKWLPSINFSFGSVKKLFAFGGNLLFSGLFDVITSNIQTLLIGKFYTKLDLGFYSQAKQLAGIPAQTLTSIIRNVTYPTLIVLQANVVQLKKAYRKIIRVAFIVVFPLMMSLMAICNNLIPVLLGEKWVPLIPYFVLLCLVGAIFPLYSINQNIFLVLGNSQLFLKVSIAKRIISLMLILITIKISVMALVVGHLVATLFNTFLTMFFSGKEINYTMLEQIKDISGTLVISSITATAMYLFDIFIKFENHALAMTGQLCFGFIIFFLLGFIFKLSALNDIKAIVQSFTSK